MTIIHTLSQRYIATLKRLKTHLGMMILIASAGLGLWRVMVTGHLAMVTADDTPTLDVDHLYTLAQAGHGQEALMELADFALVRGAWSVAPGDTLVFDPYMSRRHRGAVVDYDEVPSMCFSRQGTVDTHECIALFRAKETQVRFGFSLFSTPTDDDVVMRPADDVLATFIEETGHSWQEYIFETNGKFSGERLHKTTLTESEYWAKGREYQVKRYILSLDGNYLTLSDTQRQVLLEQICQGKGYAYPLGHEVPTYAPPPGWPNPEGWPVTTPTLNDHMTFCATHLN
jgi:hypothetical protein